MAGEVLTKVGLPDPIKRLDSYPHQLSGGMRQRVMIALALVLDPDILIADEPTTALDVTVQAQILDQLIHQQRERHMSMLLITHDLAVVAAVADRVAVMYAGEIVEQAPVDELFEDPRHPYTQGLLRALPQVSIKRLRLHPIPGLVPPPQLMPPGCWFAPRCPHAIEPCWTEHPELTTARGRSDLPLLQPAAVHLLMVTTPVPIAIRLQDGIILRGHEWSRDGPPVVFVHDLGDDLDAWGPVTARLAAHGLRVISVELRGHGLSDGEPDADSLRDDLVAMLAEISASFGPVALVAYGSITETLLFLDADRGAPVHVMIAPLPRVAASIDWRTTRPAMRLVLRGALNEEVSKHVGFIYPRMMGQKLQVTAASECAGPGLLTDQPQLLEHLLMFLRRYLTGHHLSWIADQAEQIEAVRAERLATDV